MSRVQLAEAPRQSDRQQGLDSQSKNTRPPAKNERIAAAQRRLSEETRERIRALPDVEMVGA